MDVVKSFIDKGFNHNIIIKGNYDNPLFRACDIGEILGIANIRQNIKDFDDTERTVCLTYGVAGDHNIIYLTEKGLYKVLFRSRKPIAEKFQNWVCEVIKEIRLTGQYQLEKKLEEKEQHIKKMENELKEKEDEIDKIKNSEKIPMMYIYNCDTTQSIPELKIGYTTNLYSRLRPYKQTHKNGKLEFSIELQDINIRTVESFIHELLKSYRIKDEIFKGNVDEIKFIILNLVNFIKLSNLSQCQDKINKIYKLYESYDNIINNKHKCVSTKNSDTQTEDNDFMINEINKNQNNPKITNFINEMCIIHKDIEVSASRIKGLFRLWCREANKKNTTEFTDYLNTNFKYIRLKNQDENNVIMGYKGISVKEIIYKKTLINNDVDDFIFNKCIFIPEGTVLISDIIDEFIKWKKNLDKNITNNEKEELRNYFKNNNNVLYETVWTSNGNGQGYYGLKLKTQIYEKNISSSTGKQVFKIDSNSNICIDKWPTIAKAAEMENISAAKLSRIIKNKILYNNFYYTSESKW